VVNFAFARHVVGVVASAKDDTSANHLGADDDAFVDLLSVMVGGLITLLKSAAKAP
jgi:hypothetical protein